MRTFSRLGQATFFHQDTTGSAVRMNGLIVDLFAGGGGASTGLAWALGRDPDIAINHDAEALAMHRANHPKTKHLQNDITKVLPLEATGGRPVAILHASPDCTHFSKAKGGKPRSQHIRDLAWVVVRWAEDTRPTLITLENVEEFETWGPLDRSGHPIKSETGQTFRAWVRRLRRLGYRVSWRLLRACDYGAPTIRRRLFVVARRDGKPVVWPRPTHGNPESPEVQSGKLLPWRTAAECIDWNIQSRSIFNRSKPLAPNTQRRIAEGLRRYVLQSPAPFIVTYYGAKKPDDFRGQDLGRPHPTITQSNHDALVSANLVKMRGTNIGAPVDEPLHTVSAQGQHHALIEAVCVAKHYGGIVGHGVNRPLGTVTTIDHHSLVSACMVKYYGNESGGVSITDPLHTITSKDRMGLVEESLNGENERYASVRDFLRLWGVIGENSEAEFEYDGQKYRVTDICMRMLAPRELYTAQGFPRSYIIERDADGNPLTKTAQVRMCGNSVPPPMVAALVRANGPETWESPVRPSFPLFTACCSGAYGRHRRNPAPA